MRAFAAALAVVAIGSTNGSMALHGAAASNQKSIIQYLVESGARLDARNKLGWTPLMVPKADSSARP